MAWSGSSALLFFLVPCLAGASLTRFEATEPHMGTQFRILLYAPTEEDAQRSFAAAFARVRQLDATLSDYQPDSELNQLCARAGQGAVPVSRDLFAVLEKAQAIARETNGAFDVTLGPLIRLWRSCRKEQRLPSAAEVAEARSRCGYRHLVLDAGRRTVTLLRSGMQLDVGGLAKGYAAEEALRAAGLRVALVAASGDLAMGDPPPDESGWRIGLELPRFDRVLRLRNCAVSTAGDTEQFVEIGGRRYSHIVDPRTGVGLTSRIAVSVIAARGIDADALDTAASILGEQKGLALLERHGVAAVMAKDGKLVETRAFRQLPLQ